MTDARACGPCTACCEFPALVALAKPAYELCRHAAEACCAIYAERPNACRTYACLWLEGEFELSQRPDKLGLAFDLPSLIQDHPDYAGVAVICARETRPDARNEPAAAAILTRLARGMVVRLTRWGGATALLGSKSQLDLLAARAAKR